MIWISIFGLAIVLFGMSVLPTNVPGSCVSIENRINLEKAQNLIETATECQAVLQSLEAQKLQIRSRSEMLDELIEKSDREIVRMQEQLSRMETLSSRVFDETDHEMLNLLHAGGFQADDIARLTQRNIEEIDRAA